MGRKRGASAWAQALLCREPDPLDGACGRCPSCAQAAKGVHPDCVTVDLAYQEQRSGKGTSAQHLGVDTLRETVSMLRRRPFSGAHSVCIIDGAEDLTPAAQVALLKILEESPAHCHWLWVAVSEDRLLPTIVSRAGMKIYFQPLAEDALTVILTRQFGLSEERARRTARASHGSLEQAARMIEQGGLPDHQDDRAPGYSPHEAYNLSQRTARFKNAASARKEVAGFMDELEAGVLNLWRRRPTRGHFQKLEALLQARRQLDANVTPALVLERLLLAFDEKN